jgi:branched-chain amino acid transport system permease protein
MLVATIINALSYGMLLFLISAGFSLVYGVMGILNLAHGTLFMLGAFFGLLIRPFVGGDFWIAMIIGALGAGVVGLIWERGFLSRLYGLFPEQVLTTLGFIYIFGNLTLWILGPYGRIGTPPEIAAGFTAVAGLRIANYRFLLIIVGIIAAIALYFFQERTKYGAIIRAGLSDKTMAIALGVNYNRVSTLVFVLAAVTAGLAGFLGSPIMGASHDMAFDMLLLAAAVMVIGGQGYVEGTIIGAIVVGFVDAFGKVYFPEYSSYVVYIAMIAILVFRPMGLLGRAR